MLAFKYILCLFFFSRTIKGSIVRLSFTDAKQSSTKDDKIPQNAVGIQNYSLTHWSRTSWWVGELAEASTVTSLKFRGTVYPTGGGSLKIIGLSQFKFKSGVLEYAPSDVLAYHFYDDVKDYDFDLRVKSKTVVKFLVVHVTLAALKVVDLSAFGFGNLLTFTETNQSSTKNLKTPNSTEFSMTNLAKVSWWMGKLEEACILLKIQFHGIVHPDEDGLFEMMGLGEFKFVDGVLDYQKDDVYTHHNYNETRTYEFEIDGRDDHFVQFLVVHVTNAALQIMDITAWGRLKDGEEESVNILLNFTDLKQSSTKDSKGPGNAIGMPDTFSLTHWGRTSWWMGKLLNISKVNSLKFHGVVYPTGTGIFEIMGLFKIIFIDEKLDYQSVDVFTYGSYEDIEEFKLEIEGRDDLPIQFLVVHVTNAALKIMDITAWGEATDSKPPRKDIPREEFFKGLTKKYLWFLAPLLLLVLLLVFVLLRFRKVLNIGDGGTIESEGTVEPVPAKRSKKREKSENSEISENSRKPRRSRAFSKSVKKTEEKRMNPSKLDSQRHSKEWYEDHFSIRS